MEFNKQDFGLEDTELRLGLPGTEGSKVQGNKRSFSEIREESTSYGAECGTSIAPPTKKAQVMGWPPIRSYRKNCLKAMKDAENGALYVKVSMDGAPYLRKIDMKVYAGYTELVEALQDMFKVTLGEYSKREGYNGSECLPTYEDKDGDWMLVGDVPWEMFISSCKRLRIMKGSEARGFGRFT